MSDLDDIYASEKKVEEFAKLIANHMPTHVCSFTPEEVTTLKAVARWIRIAVFAAVTAAITGVGNLGAIVIRLLTDQSQ